MTPHTALSQDLTSSDVRSGAQRIPRLLLLLTALTLVVDVAFVRSVGDVATLLLPVVFGGVGWLITRREPANVEGRLLLLVGLAWAAILILPFPGAWAAPVGIMGTHLILRFPDGQLPSPRWRWFSRWCTFLIVALTVIITTASRFDDSGAVNPYYVSWTEVFSVLLVTFPVTLLICVVSVVVRYRRADQTARAQIRWLGAAAAAIVLVYTAALVTSFAYDATHQIDSAKSTWFESKYPWWILALELVALFSFLLIPLAFGIAITRYRLYEIDRVISRTTSYVLVTGAVIAVYAATVTLISRLMPDQSSFPVAAATLVAAAVFQPVLRRVRTMVDRRFDRTRYDQLRIIDRFGRQLRAQVQSRDVTDSLTTTVRDALQPATMTLWLRESA
jgi:hypothetical protein